MTTLEHFIKAIDYKVTGGSEYGWKCFGDNARYLDSMDNEGVNGTYSVSAIFDSHTQQVYLMEAWDYVNDREYRWIDPDYRSAHDRYAKKMKVDVDESLDDRKWIDLEIHEDMLEKINALVNGKEYDTRVKVPVDFTDEDLLQYMKLAHEMDITFNELVERAIKAAIEDFDRNPESYKQTAEKFINENYRGV